MFLDEYTKLADSLTTIKIKFKRKKRGRGGVALRI